MKVALLSVASDFRPGSGRAVPAYASLLFEQLSRRGGIEIVKEVCPNLKVGESLSLYLGSMFRDFSQYDAVHNIDTRPINLMRRGKALIVNTVHDCQPITAPELNADLKRTFAGRVRMGVIQPWGYRRAFKADYIIAPSTMTRDDVIGLGYPKERISVVNSGIDAKYFAPVAPVKHTGFKVGYIGSFRLRKNVAFAINAFKKLGATDAAFELWGKQRFEYANLAKLAAGDGRIAFKGFAPEDAIVGIYESFDAFVYPSLYEGQGWMMLEAQARGLPVVICKDSRIPAETRKYCFEAKDEEDMAGMLDDLRKNGYDAKRRKAAMEYARSFTWERAADGTVNAYKNATEIGRLNK